MTRLIWSRVGTVCAVVVLAAPAANAQVATPRADDGSTPTFSLKAPEAQPAQPSTEPGFAMRLLRDVGGDYKHFFSTDTALVLGIGGAAALAVHPADDNIAEHVQATNPDLDGGELYGSQLLQVPVAIGWWIAGAAAGSQRHAEAGRDLLRAQIQAFSWTYSTKFIVNRTRPNGDTHSFPSGHASTSFATAAVLEQHFGWKVGVPAYAMATYTAISRVTDNQHWTSDVVFGAAIGIACGRTATRRLRNFEIAPVALHRGAAVFVTTVDRE